MQDKKLGKGREIVGYTCGVFDLFHIGHVKILENAKALCDRLIVGVTEDDTLMTYKGKRAVIPFHERIEVVRACRYVDLAIPQRDLDKVKAWKKLKFDILFVGDDWYQDKKWKVYEKGLTSKGAKIVYFPYHTGTSSTIINDTLKALREDKS